DVVPFFRLDLRVARGASPGLFEVSDPASGKSFTLYEFELAVARMLDGRRKVSEVVESGVRLGIPVDVQGLHKFARQMWHYGFLAPPGAPGEAQGGPDATWQEREPWDDATRALYQTGLRLVRLGRPADAAGYFEAILAARPSFTEATEMLALIAQGRSVAATPLGAPGGVGAPAEGRAAQAAPPPQRARRAALVAAALTVAVAGGVVVRVRPAPSAPGPSPAAVAAAVALPSPPSPAPEPGTPRWRSAPVDARRHPALAEVVAPGSGAVRWSKATGAAVRAGERIGEIRVETAAAPRPELAREIAELERLAAQDPVYGDFLEKARRERRRASRGRARAVPLVAPAAGELARPVDGARRADKGAALARIVDPGAWHLGAVLYAAAPPPGAACEVVGDTSADRAACTLVAAVEQAGGDAGAPRAVITVEVSAAAAPWLGRAQSPYVRLAPPGAPPAPTPGAAP
ncbi:MAG TPA: hypothetical protein VFL83_06765, partial [Anaeromyxobacter sp.]|nr:hypothetical protein [Anaeromyxobacter sp.]